MLAKKRVKSVWNIIKSYKYKSTFFNYLKSLLVVLLVPTLILTFVLMYFYNTSHIKSAISSGIQSNLKTNNSAEKMLMDISRINYILYNNTNIKACVLNTKENLLTEESIKQRQYTLNTISTYLNSTETIDSIYIYSMQSNFIISNFGSYDLKEFYDLSWYNRYKKDDISMFIQTSYPKENGTKNPLMTFVYPLNYDGNLDGLAVINIRLSIFNDMLNTSNNEIVSLIDLNGNTLYSKNPDYINKKFPLEIPEFETTFGEIDNYTINCYSKLESYPLILSTQSDLPTSMRTGSLVLMFSTYMFFMVLILIILSFILSTKFYLDISDIIVALGLSETAIPENTNELMLIKSSILSNADKIEKIESELFEKSDKLKTSQQTALQMQISPHFILNTLNTVNLLLLTEENNDKALQINSLLSELLGSILNTSNYMITINEEIKYTKKYLEIETYKSQNSFDVKWYIDPSCENVKTIKFILQPIVENSIFHGIKHLKNKRGLIEIAVKRYNSDIILTVSDNGPGMSEEKIRYFNENAKKQTIPHDKHIGFLNVNMRLKLAYGNEYGCEIVKSDSSGTTVKISIHS